MSYTSSLYQQVILDHTKKPRNFRPMEQPTHFCHGRNPLCGDEVTVFLKVDGGTVNDASFQGKGCSICTSSTSMMTEHVKGKSVQDVEAAFGEFHKMILGEFDPNAGPNHLGKLKVFEGVKEYPARTKCATLPWHAVHTALAGAGDEVTTE